MENFQRTVNSLSESNSTRSAAADAILISSVVNTEISKYGSIDRSR